MDPNQPTGYQPQQPSYQPQPPTQPTPPPEKKRIPMWTLMLIAVGLISLITIIVVVVLLNVFGEVEEEPVEEMQDETVATQQADDASTKLIAELEKQIANQLDDLTKDEFSNAPLQIFSDDIQRTVVLYPGAGESIDYSYETELVREDGRKYGPDVLQGALLAEQQFLSAGLEARGEPLGVSISDGDWVTAYYFSDNTECKIFIKGNLSLDCVSRTRLKEAANNIKQFYDAYENAFSYEPDRLVYIDTNDIEVLDNGYERVGGTISQLNGADSSIAYFYRPNGGEWTYSHSGDEVRDCEEFEEDGQHKAFGDLACINVRKDIETTIFEYH